jgi:hypothetical protein
VARVRTLALALIISACGLAVVVSAAAADDPLSDADGDGLPYVWETPQPVAVPAVGTTPPRKCGAKKRLRKGRCVPKCKKGKKLKGRKCVGKKGKKKKRTKRHPARAAQVAGVVPANLAAFGADPNHKDIFVQIDYASAGLKQNVASACGELDALVAAFASAPVANPDGRTGINLHLDAGVTCPSRSYDLGGSRVFSAGLCPDTGATMQSAELPESRAGTFHIAGFSPTCGGGGGAATLHGVKMAIFTDGFSFAHVLMHELGHNLGLDHPYPGQPNRISSMNTRLAVSNDGNGSDEVLDYQRISLPALDENNLSEAAGISASAAVHRFYIPHYCENAVPDETRYAWPGDGPIDWNCSELAIMLPPFTFTPDPGPVSADVNGDGQKTLFPATDNEWVTLDYASGGKIGL